MVTTVLVFFAAIVIVAIVGFKAGRKYEKVLRIESVINKTEVDPPFPAKEHYNKDQWAILEKETKEMEDYVASRGYPPGTSFYDVLNAEQHDSMIMDPEEARIIYGKPEQT